MSTLIITARESKPLFRFLPMAALNLKTESHLVRLHGRVGWLTYDAMRKEVTLRKPFGALVVQPDELAHAHEVEDGEVAEYYDQCRFVSHELGAIYESNINTGD
jgi:hypothetical protein